MERAKNEGYRVVCVYVLTKDPEINVERVKNRVKKGGQDVDHEKIRARYHRAMKLFPKLLEICDECYVYDNSPERGEGEPERILSLQYGNLELIPTKVWSMEMITELCMGIYGEISDEE